MRVYIELSARTALHAVGVLLIVAAIGLPLAAGFVGLTFLPISVLLFIIAAMSFVIADILQRLSQQQKQIQQLQQALKMHAAKPGH